MPIFFRIQEPFFQKFRRERQFKPIVPNRLAIRTDFDGSMIEAPLLLSMRVQPLAWFYAQQGRGKSRFFKLEAGVISQSRKRTRARQLIDFHAIFMLAGVLQPVQFFEYFERATKMLCEAWLPNRQAILTV